MTKPSFPLAGKKVVITRPEESADELVQLLTDRKAVPWVLPLIRTKLWHDLTAVDQAIAHLDEYDGLLFTSGQAVHYFFKRLVALYAEAGEGAFEEDPRAVLKRKKVVAVGPKTASLLESYGIPFVHTPDEYRQEGLVQLVIHLFPPNSRLLYPRASKVRPLLLETLREKGYRLTDVILYQTEFVNQEDSPYFQAILEREADAVTFTSASAVKAFDRLFRQRAHDLKKENLPPLAFIGPVAAKEAEKLGYPTPIVAQEYTVSGLVKALESYFAWQEGKTKA